MAVVFSLLEAIRINPDACRCCLLEVKVDEEVRDFMTSATASAATLAMMLTRLAPFANTCKLQLPMHEQL
jgi:hypothetical protein